MTRLDTHSQHHQLWFPTTNHAKPAGPPGPDPDPVLDEAPVTALVCVDLDRPLIPSNLFSEGLFLFLHSR